MRSWLESRISLMNRTTVLVAWRIAIILAVREIGSMISQSVLVREESKDGNSKITKANTGLRKNQRYKSKENRSMGRMSCGKNYHRFRIFVSFDFASIKSNSARGFYSLCGGFFGFVSSNIGSQM